MAIEHDNSAAQDSLQVPAPLAPAAPGVPAHAHATASDKTWLAVPFAEKDEAREAGARWDKEAKAWFAPAGTDLQPLERWAPKRDVALAAERKQDQNPQAEFAKALKAAGLVLEGDPVLDGKHHPVMDGKLHRVPVVEGRKGARDGAYVGYLDARPSGYIQNFVTGHKETWTNAGMQLTAEEQAHFAAQMQLAKQQRDADLAAQHAKAAERAQAKWGRLLDTPPSAENAYLERKGVGAHGVKFDGEKLVVPLRDIDGKLWSLQSIAPEEGGAKRFEKDGRKAGNMHVLGELRPGADVFVAEGYATGASLHEATGMAVVVAFDSGNLDAVVGAVKQRYPTNPIYIMGDDDRHQKQNVGREKAIDAAQKHQVGVAFPAFAAEGKLSDFNDLHKREGLAMVKAQAAQALSQSMEQSRDQAVQLATAAPKAQATERIASEGDRLTAGDAAIGAAHAAQLAQVGGPLAHTALQVVGIVDAERIASDVAAGKEVRSMDVASAAASVTMTTGLGGPAVQAGAKAIAGLSALEAGHRALNTVNDQLGDTKAGPSQDLAQRVDAARGTEARQAVVDQPDPADAERRRAIEQRNVEVMPIPRDALSAKDVQGWVSDDLAAFRSIKDAHERREAANAMGHSAQEQIAYKTELTRQDPEASRLVSRIFVDVQRTLIEEDRATTAARTWQEFEANFFSERHIAFKRDGTAQAQFGAERLERLVKEDLLALSLLRGHEREPQAKVLVQEAMANEVYRAEYERETALWKLQPAVDADKAAPGKTYDRKNKEPDPADVEQRQAIERRSSDLWAVPRDALAEQSGKLVVKMDIASLHDIDDPRERHAAAVAMGRNAQNQSSYKAELARQDPHTAEAVALAYAEVQQQALARAGTTRTADRDGPSVANDAVNSIEYVSARELQPDSPETAALRKQVAQSRMSPAATAPEQATSAADDTRVLDTIARMTRPELDEYVQARNTSQEQADQVLRSAQKRMEADVDRPATRSAVPPLEDRFNIVTHVGRRDYEFRDQPGKVAFTERWLSMQSTVDAVAVVKAMVDRAQERGWTALRVNGSTEFERQVWVAATARGIKAVGYEPTDGDRQVAREERERLNRDRDVQMPAGGTITREAAREQTIPAWANTQERAAEANEPRAQSTAAAAAPVQQQQRPAAEPPIAKPLRNLLIARGEAANDVEAIVAVAAEQMRHKRVYAGQVVAHGEAPYDFNKDNAMSYYVKLAQPEGEKIIWGVDLPRALDKGQVKVGDSVALEHRGQQPVMVVVQDRDATGRVIGEHEEEALRNTWFAANIEHLRAEGIRRASAQEQSAPARPEARDSTSTLNVVPLLATPAPATQPRNQSVRDPQIEAALEAAFEAKNVPQALREGLREQLRKELGKYQARGETVKVKVYDPAASRQVQRSVQIPQRQREEQERAR